MVVLGVIAAVPANVSKLIVDVAARTREARERLPSSIS
jgi:hypothetical protein